MVPSSSLIKHISQETEDCPCRCGQTDRDIKDQIKGRWLKLWKSAHKKLHWNSDFFPKLFPLMIEIEATFLLILSMLWTVSK